MSADSLHPAESWTSQEFIYNLTFPHTEHGRDECSF
jgi:hypothetical protein